MSPINPHYPYNGGLITDIIVLVLIQPKGAMDRHRPAIYAAY